MMQERYRFDGFLLLQPTRQFLQDDSPVALAARAFDLMCCLVENRDRAVSKVELISNAWPKSVMGENNLNVQIAA